MENEKEERTLTEEDESIKIPEKGSSKYFRLFLFSFVLFLFAYWLGANQSENDTLFGQIREKALACIGKVTVVSGNNTREEEIENSVLDASILDMEDPTEKIALETQVQSQDNTQITQNAKDNTTPQFHIVAKGDTLRSISMYYYGDYDMIDAICQLNQIEDSNCIECGQTLFLP